MSFKWIAPKMFKRNGINSHFAFLRESLRISISCIWFIYWRWFGRRSKQPVSAICFSLSSASPAHTPKEEYAITQTASTPKEDTLHDQPEDQGGRQDDKSELTEGKSMTGWSAARHLLLSVKGCVESCVKDSPSSSVMSPVSFIFRGGASLRIVSLSWA